MSWLEDACDVLGAGQRGQACNTGPPGGNLPRKLTLEGEGLIFLVQGRMWEGQRAADSGKGWGDAAEAAGRQAEL